MNEIHEKLIYINEKGESINIGYSFPFFLQEILGADSVKNNLNKSKAYNQDGETVFNSGLESRDITIAGNIKGSSKDELERYRRELLKVFNPKLKGVLTYEYGSLRKSIKCEVEEGPKFSKESLWRYQKFLIHLLCPNPFWTDDTLSSIDIAYWQGDFSFPLEIPEEGIEMGYRNEELLMNIINNGDVNCGMIVEFKALGTVVNPSILNVFTREFIKINRTMQPEEVIKVNTNWGNKRIESTLNSVTTNIFQYLDLDSTFIQLATGDNYIKYNADQNVNNLEVTITYSPKYLGV